MTRVLGLALVLGCSSSAPDKLGRRIAQNVFDPNGGLGHQLLWSADGSEVFYISTGSESEIRAAKVDGSGTRVVQPGIGRSIGWLAAPPDGSALYFLTGSDTAVWQAQPQMRTLDQTYGAAYVLVASSDDIHISYGRFIYDTTQAAAVSVAIPNYAALACCWSTVVFSPAGDQLFIMNPSTGDGLISDLAGNPVGSTLTLAVNPQDPYGGFPVGMQPAGWSDRGIQILEGGSVRQIENLTTGALTPLVVPDGFQLSFVDYMAWSRDGTTVGFTAHGCTPDEPAADASFCVADAVSGVTRTVATGSDLVFGDIAFAPDGARVAYVVHDAGSTARSDLYIIDTPSSAMR
jgi:hypothetical protein